MRAVSRQFLLRFLTLLFSLSLGASAVGDEVPQYLFLIDLSPQMAQRQIATAQTVYDLIRTGFHDRIQPGEKFALWFYGSRLQTNAPFTWDSSRDVELAHRAGALFTGRIYSKLRPREQTLADAAPFLAASPRLTIFILTDGFQPITAAPFDTEINAALVQYRDQFARAEKPFLITLFAENGKWITANIHTNLNGPVEIAAPIRPELIDKAVSSLRSAPSAKSAVNPLDQAEAVLREALAEKPKSKTNAPAQAAALSQIAAAFGDEPTLPKPVLTAQPLPSKPIEKEKETLAEPPPKPVEVKIEPPPEPKPAVVETPTPVVVAAATPIPDDSGRRRGNESSPQNSSRPIDPPHDETPPPVTKSVLPPELPIQTPPAQLPSKHPFPWTILFVALCLVAAFGGRAFARARFRARNPESIITQALPGEGNRPRSK